MTGTVFAFLGGRDRIGTTTAAASVAGSMAETATRVAVVDATFAGSGVQDVLDLPDGEAGLRDVLRGDASVDEAMIDGPHGVEYLLAEELPTTTDVRTHRLVRAANTLRERYDFVLLDLGHGGGVEVAMGLELADEAILVSGSAEEDLAETAKTATVVRYHDCRIRGTILSRVPSVQAVDTVGVTERLQTDMLAVVPEDDAVREAAADGQSVLRYDPDSDAAMVYWQLAGSLSGSGGLTGPVLPADATAEEPDEEEPEASDSREEPEPVTDEEPSDGGEEGEPATGEADAPPQDDGSAKDAHAEDEAVSAQPAPESATSESEPTDTVARGPAEESPEEASAEQADGHSTDTSDRDGTQSAEAVAAPPVSEESAVDSDATEDRAVREEDAEQDGRERQPSQSDDQDDVSPEQQEADLDGTDSTTSTADPTSGEFEMGVDDSESETGGFEMGVEDSASEPDGVEMDADDSETGGFEMDLDTSETTETGPMSTEKQDGDADAEGDEFELPGFESATGAEDTGSRTADESDAFETAGDAEATDQSDETVMPETDDDAEAIEDGAEAEEDSLWEGNEDDTEVEESADGDGVAPEEAATDVEEAVPENDEEAGQAEEPTPDPADGSEDDPMFEGVSADPDDILDDEDGEDDDEINALFKETMDKVTEEEDDDE